MMRSRQHLPDCRTSESCATSWDAGAACLLGGQWTARASVQKGKTVVFLVNKNERLPCMNLALATALSATVCRVPQPDPRHAAMNPAFIIGVGLGSAYTP
jgi:hypothetical protein